MKLIPHSEQTTTIGIARDVKIRIAKLLARRAKIRPAQTQLQAFSALMREWIAEQEKLDKEA